MGPSVKVVLTICSNGFALLHKIAAMLTYGNINVKKIAFGNKEHTTD